MDSDWLSNYDMENSSEFLSPIPRAQNIRDYLANVGGGQLLSTSSQNVFVVDNSYDHDNLLKTHLSCVAGENKLLIELQISLCVGYDGYQCVVGCTVHLSS